MLSPYTLIFDDKSVFNEVSDVNIIAKNEDSAITLGEVYSRHVLHQEFDIVACIVEIKPENSYQKRDKTYRVRDVVIADPEAMLTMNAHLWRWDQQLTAEMIGKVVIFSRFHLSEYKGSMSLCSGINSSLVLTHEHRMKAYEGAKVDISGFKCTTEERERKEENATDFCLNTVELSQKIEQMGEGDVIKSILNVWVVRMALGKKWCYNACPKCKKGAENYTKCQGCGHIIEETHLSFSMGVEVSDFAGSIWVTAYD